MQGFNHASEAAMCGYPRKGYSTDNSQQLTLFFTFPA